jgi:type I restriction enzyme S subunit
MSEGNGLPEGWVWSILSACCEKIQDGTHFSPPQDRQRPAGEFPYITAKNVRPSGLDLRNLTFLAEEDHRPIYDRCDTKRDDVLLVKDGVNAGDACINTLEGEASLLSSVCMLRTRLGALDARFLRFYLLSPAAYSRLTGQMTGTAIKRIILQAVRGTPCPIPPLPEQHRIVEKIEALFGSLDEAVAALTRARANLKRYRASVLKSAVEGRLTEEWRKANPQAESGTALLERILRERRENWERDQLASFRAKGKEPPKGWRERYAEPEPPETGELQELPEGWAWGSMEQITSAERVICYGILMPKDDVADGVLYVKVRDMKGDRVDVGSLNRTAIEIARKFPRSTLREDDLLLSIRGTFGRVAIVPKELEGGNITQDTARIAVLRGIEHRFVANWLRSDFSQRYLKQVARGVAVKGVNIGDIRPMPAPLPPLAEQRAIVALVEERLSQIDDAEKVIEEQLARAGRLRQSILKRAFEGRLVPRDPNDEPASVLLERIKASVDAEPKAKGKRKTPKAKARTR